MNNFIFRKKRCEDKIKYYLFGIQIYIKRHKKPDTLNFEMPSSFLRLVPQKFLKLLLVNIVEQCNLNCKNCCHFSSIAENEFMDINVYENDIKRLLELTNNKPHIIQNIQLCGGEPLLHPQLCEFFAVSRKYFPVNDLTIVTNGILLNQQREEFWQNCNKYNVRIAPTVYPIKINWDSIEQKAKLYKVKLDYGYVLGETVEKKPEHLKTSWHWPMDLEGNKDPLVSFANCNVGNNCVTLHHGKIYTCSLPTGIKHFNKYFDKNLQVSEADGINIYGAKNFDEILEFIAKPIPFCRYCDVQKRTYNHQWGYHIRHKREDNCLECQSNEISIKEWVL